MTTPLHPRREDLTSIRWLNDWATTARMNPSSERIISDSLQPLRQTADAWWPTDMHKLVASTISFCFDAPELEGILASCEDSPTGLPLPPLPFKRILIEAVRDGQAASLFSAGWTHGTDDISEHAATPYDDTDQDVALEFALIFEETPGSRWNILVWTWYAEIPHDAETLGIGRQVPADASGGLPLAFGLTPDGAVYQPDPVADLEPADDALAQLIRGLCVDAVHAIHARTVRRLELLGHRQFRRGFERSYKSRPPQVYFVDVGGSGETHAGGVSNREYHFRWLVRGHYRHTDGGRLLHPVTGQQATWVRPHVKGPVGAPWKGRPVHLVHHEPDAA